MKAVEHKGGKCIKCGYSNIVGLDFHHLRDKEHTISSLCEKGARWNQIEKELKKCELLCSNCHREHHCPNKIEFEFDHQSLLDNRKRKLEARVVASCKYCHKTFMTCRESPFCSRKCMAAHHEQTVPSLAEIEKARETRSWRKTGKHFGVCYSKIRRWWAFRKKQVSGMST
jgi:hypothetical protein